MKVWRLYLDPSDQQRSDISESSATCHSIALLFSQIICNLSVSLCGSPSMHEVIFILFIFFHSAIQVAITLRYIGCHMHSARHKCPGTHLLAIRCLQDTYCTCRNWGLPPREIFKEHIYRPIYLYMFFPTSFLFRHVSDTVSTSVIKDNMELRKLL